MKKIYTLLAAAFFVGFACAQTTVTLTADRDNTIYSESNNTSNGAGQNIFAGVTNRSAIRRALLHFDLSSVPAGSVISSATLTLFADRLAGNSQGIAVHKLTNNWGEGTSDATANEGSGATATANDATWDRRFVPATFWTAAGGDYVATATAQSNPVATGTVTLSTPALLADVQGFVNNAASNFGWILLGTNEAATATSIRFASRHHPTIAQRPTLTLTFAQNAPVPVRLTSFTATVNNQNVVLQWQTASEFNNAYFAIEHGTDGIVFTSVGRVNGSGTSGVAHRYSFTHNGISSGKHFYRLAQYDYDGGVHYSPTISLSYATVVSLQVTPNPAVSFIEVSGTSVAQGSAFIIRTFTGQVVKKGRLTGGPIDVSQLPAGEYWLNIRNDKGERLNARFIKK